MANRGWDAVRRSKGLYPVPPVRPGGKWRPAGADRPPAPPPTLVQEVARDLGRAIVGLRMLDHSCQFTTRVHPDFGEELAELRWPIKVAVKEFEAWQKRVDSKLETHVRAHEVAFYQRQADLAAERHEQRKLERREKAKKERAKKKRAAAKAKKRDAT